MVNTKMSNYTRQGPIVHYHNTSLGLYDRLFECRTGKDAQKAIEQLEKLNFQLETLMNDYEKLHQTYKELERKDSILNDHKLFSRRLLETDNESLKIAIKELTESNKTYREMINELKEKNKQLEDYIVQKQFTKKELIEQ